MPWQTSSARGTKSPEDYQQCFIQNPALLPKLLPKFTSESRFSGIQYLLELFHGRHKPQNPTLVMGFGFHSDRETALFQLSNTFTWLRKKTLRSSFKFKLKNKTMWQTTWVILESAIRKSCFSVYCCQCTQCCTPKIILKRQSFSADLFFTSAHQLTQMTSRSMTSYLSSSKSPNNTFNILSCSLWNALIFCLALTSSSCSNS